MVIIYVLAMLEPDTSALEAVVSGVDNQAANRLLA
jgi:hypothetical protein